MRATTVTDPADPRLADYRDLTDVALRNHVEQPLGLFIAEGELVLRRALRAGYRARSILVDAKRVDQFGDLDAGDVPLYAASAEVMQALTGFHVHRGVLAALHRRPTRPVGELLAAARRIAVLEGLNNYTNLGAIFRSAAALGLDAVLLSPTCTDPLYRRTVRVSMGEVFAVPFARLDPWPDGLGLVRDAGFTLLGMTPASDATPIQSLSPGQRVRPAILVGAEGPGLSDDALKACDVRVSIPMSGGVDSLNVATASAIAFWELAREDQRSGQSEIR
ncbi:rRNA methyltransferase [Virgisporangium aliadipatigenens]|uniref:rRNA methyltransferase n=1 Tax=Virgisporangium aliadipatigenens TaxID=741659 RepID=A0A8J4DQX1_9ACTN|nr:RNA methyltransferase [Virgisporangium aliadipatigenens]GIJ47515.1 rRNA methyltransferase [Virgisporangium aliadipatigenens]